MNPASKFSIMLFIPVQIALLLPSIFLLPIGISHTLVAILNPNVSLSGAVAFDLWAVGPFIIVFILFLIGRGLHALHQQLENGQISWGVIWIVFTTALFLALWFDFTVLGGIGAADKPIQIFIGWTALFAGGMTLILQPLAIPWLVALSRTMPRDDKPHQPGPVVVDREILDQEK